MAYLNLDGDKDSLFSYLRDFNGKMSLLLTAMLARDYLRKLPFRNCVPAE